MLRYLSTDIYTVEIPDELSLGITILGCPIHCKNCHSSHVWDINSLNQGKDLTEDVFKTLLHPLVTCILFFGGEWDLEYLINLLLISKSMGYKTALYTGLTDIDTRVYEYLDYIKLGPYIEELGGLDHRSTNQRLYRINNGILDKDITFKFWH